MSFIDKLKFWKKKDDFDLGGDFGGGSDPFGGAGGAGAGNDPFGAGAGGAGDPLGGAGGNFGGLGGTKPPSPTDSFGGASDFSQPPTMQAGGPSLPAEMHQPASPGVPPVGSMGNASASHYGGGQQLPYGVEPMGMSSGVADKNMEIISLKLDAIKKSIELLNTRMRKLELMAEQAQQPGYEERPRARW